MYTALNLSIQHLIQTPPMIFKFFQTFNNLLEPSTIELYKFLAEYNKFSESDWRVGNGGRESQEKSLGGENIDRYLVSCVTRESNSHL